MNRRSILMMLVAACTFGLAACDFGTVDQGRVIAFDEASRNVTIVQDVKHDQRNPEYSGAVVTYKLPDNPAEVGPLPSAGGRLKLDVEKKCVVIYNPATKAIETVAVNFTDLQRDINKDHPLVKGKKFPVIDKVKNTVTEYSPRQKVLATFVVPADKIALPDNVWEAGHEVRIYYKENAAHQALRFMNITKTNIYKK